MVLLLIGKIIHPMRQALGLNVVTENGLRLAPLERMLLTMTPGTTWDTTARGAVSHIASEQQTMEEPLHMRLATTASATVMSTLRTHRRKGPRYQVRIIVGVRQKTWLSWLMVWARTAPSQRSNSLRTATSWAKLQT